MLKVQKLLPLELEEEMRKRNSFCHVAWKGVKLKKLI